MAGRSGSGSASANCSAVRMTGARTAGQMSAPRSDHGGADPLIWWAPRATDCFAGTGAPAVSVRPLPGRVRALSASGADGPLGRRRARSRHAPGRRTMDRAAAGGRFSGRLGRRARRRLDQRVRRQVLSLGRQPPGATWRARYRPVPGVCPALAGASATEESTRSGTTASLRWDGARGWGERGPFKGPRESGSLRRASRAQRHPLARDASISALWRCPVRTATCGPSAGRSAAQGFDGLAACSAVSAGRWTKVPTPRTEGHLLSTCWGLATTTSGRSDRRG